jgi:threonine aldolase
MRTAIATAEVGDDVYGEDLTINRMEQLAAEIMGKEAAVLVPSGTMGNLSALLAHCQRGQRVILGSECHIFHYEVSGAATLGGLVYHLVPNLPGGTLDPDALRAALHHDPGDVHLAAPGVVCLENTHNRCGGTVLTPDYIEQIHTLAQQHDVPLHLDGARIFNAAIALDVDVRAFTRHVDSIQFCLSKGLSAPVGSMVAGTHEFVQRVRVVRKMLGGGMRQAGIIAAAGIVALTEMVERLRDDHQNAALLAAGLSDIPGILIDPSQVQTNMVVFRLADPQMTVPDFLAALREQGVLMSDISPDKVRALTHYGIGAHDITAAVAAARRVLTT